MFTEGALRIEIHRGKKLTALEIQAERALIGSGAHCDVRLAPDEAAIEQLAIETLDEEVHVRVLALDRRCLLNGAPFLEGRLQPTSMLELGNVFICAKFIARQATETKKRGKSATPPAFQAVALAGLAVGFYYVLNDPSGSAAARRVAPSPPSLAMTDEPCPQEDPVTASSLAVETLFAAENKRERAPFYPSDGLAAMRMFARAGSCYERAGNEPAAHDAREAAAQLQRRLSDELHVRHVRLERLLAQQKYAEAKREGQLIAEFIADPTHEYNQWLSAVVREGELQAHKEEKK